MSKTIVVPVDGSKHSKKALEFACEYASKFEHGIIPNHPNAVSFSFWVRPR